MRLTVAGCWGGSPRPGGACSGYLVQHGGTSVLLDCGAGVAGSVQRACALTDIDDVIVSHFHHDHVSDAGVLMFARLVARQLGQTDHTLTFYAPGFGGMSASLDTHTAFDLARLEMPGASHAVALDPTSRLSIGSLSFDFLQTKHPAPCLATRVTCEEDGAKLVYTADAALTSDLAAFCAGADVLLCECSLYAGYDGQAMGHMSCEDVVELARVARPGTLVLTHLPIYGDVTDLLAYVRSGLAPDEVADVLLADRPPAGALAGDMLSISIARRKG